MIEIIFKEGGRNQRIFESMWHFNQGFWFEGKSPKTTTNLCQWVRVVIIWPFFHIAAFIASAYALYSSVSYCLRELDDPVVSSNFWSDVIITALFIALILATIFTLVFINYWKRRQRLALATTEPHSVGDELETPWHKLIWAYLVALKQQVCPIIRYVDREVI